jgi:hypothetical protein
MLFRVGLAVLMMGNAAGFATSNRRNTDLAAPSRLLAAAQDLKIAVNRIPFFIPLNLRAKGAAR